MEMHDEDYKKKLEMGKIIYKNFRARNIVEESLLKAYKEAK